MVKFYVPSTFLTIKDEQVFAVVDFKLVKKQIIEKKSWLTILEIFIHQQDLEAAYHKFKEIKSLPIPKDLLSQCQKICNEIPELFVTLAPQSLIVYTHEFSSFTEPEKQVNLSAQSQEYNQVLNSLFYSSKFVADEDKIGSFEVFSQLVAHLLSLGLLAPALTTVDWGDFKRKAPMCPILGYTRGTPIERYYLEQFVNQIRHHVTGNVLEVGGTLENKEIYQFDKATKYHAVNLEAGRGVSIVGDIHSSELLEPSSLDTAVIFNVLEHCHDPWVVVQNIYHALKVGGKCFCFVPNVQRYHDAPGDYWRILPDGLKQLFREFSEQKLHVYGNPQMAIATLMGMTVEEVSPEELDEFHPDYAVSTGIFAVK